MVINHHGETHTVCITAGPQNKFILLTQESNPMQGCLLSESMVGGLNIDFFPPYTGVLG